MDPLPKNLLELCTGLISHFQSKIATLIEDDPIGEIPLYEQKINLIQIALANALNQTIDLSIIPTAAVVPFPSNQ